MGQYINRLKRLGIPLYAYSTSISFILLCLCIISLLAFFYVSKKMEQSHHHNVDLQQIPKIVKYQVETQSAPLFALAESHIAQHENIHSVVNDPYLRAEFVHVHAPTFRFSNQVYYITYFLEDGASVFLINMEHIKRLSLLSSIDISFINLLKDLNPPEYSKYVLYTVPAHDMQVTMPYNIENIRFSKSTQKDTNNSSILSGRLEFYGSHGELIESRMCPHFLAPTLFPFYQDTINARTLRISRPYRSHVADAAALTLSYPIQDTIEIQDIVENTSDTQSPEKVSDSPTYDTGEQKDNVKTVKGVYAITLHFDQTLLHNELISLDTSVFILNDDLSQVISAQPAQRDVAILERCNANAIINGDVVVHAHDPVLLRETKQKSMSVMFQDFLDYNRDQSDLFRQQGNIVNFNGYDFHYYYTSAIVHGEKLNLLIWDRAFAKDYHFPFLDFGVFFMLLALLLIMLNFYIIYRKTRIVIGLCAEARRLANYDFSTPPKVQCHSIELMGLHRSLATIRLMLIEAFEDSPYRAAIKFDDSGNESNVKPYTHSLTDEEIENAVIALENDFIHGKFTEEQYIQAKLYYKQKAMKEKTLLLNASNIDGPVQNSLLQSKPEGNIIK